MIIIRSQNTRSIETPNGNHGTSLATRSLGATEVSVVRQRQQPGGFNPLHSQDREEVMVMLLGHVTVSSADQTVQLEAGDTLIVEKGVQHRVDNTSSEDAEWLIVSQTGGKFFRETGEEAHPQWAL